MGSWSGVNVRRNEPRPQQSDASRQLTEEQRWACVLAEKLMLVEQYHEKTVWYYEGVRATRMNQLGFSELQVRDVQQFVQWLVGGRPSKRPKPREAWAKYHEFREDLAVMVGCGWDKIETTPTSVVRLAD